NERIMRTQPKEVPKQGTNPEPTLQNPNRDPAVRLGLLALGSMLDMALALPPQTNPGKPPVAVSSGVHRSQNYLPWSLERVAVAFGLETIGKKDWYGMGSELLLLTQSQDGYWTNTFTGPVAETCFGLLFLRRANLAPDLSARLRGHVKDT